MTDPAIEDLLTEVDIRTKDGRYTTTAKVLGEHPHGAPYVWLPADWPLGATVIVSLVPGDLVRAVLADADHTGDTDG